MEAGFARDMIVHHAQAVQMAEIVRDHTGSEEIRNLAAGISLGQQAEIGQMRGWLEAWGLPTTAAGPPMAWMGEPRDGMTMPGMATPEEVGGLQKAFPEEIDILFLQLMIRHHEAAVPMAEAALEETNRPEVEQFATAVAASQRGEIAKMQSLLRNRGVPVEAPSVPGGSYGND